MSPIFFCYRLIHEGTYEKKETKKFETKVAKFEEAKNKENEEEGTTEDKKAVKEKKFFTQKKFETKDGNLDGKPKEAKILTEAKSK
jgi:hypothetical protein